MAGLIITLIIIGLLLIAAEFLIIPGFGLAGIFGILFLCASCGFAFSAFGHTAGLIVVAVNILLIVAGTILILRTKTWKKIGLRTNIDAKVDKAPQQKGISVGQRGTTLTRLAPGGQARIGDHNVEVFTRDTLIGPGCEVEVTEIRENRIFVGILKNQ